MNGRPVVVDHSFSYIQKSQSQSRTSGNSSSNSNARRRTRVMSDDDDIIMDETNQVCIKLLLIFINYFYIIQSSYGVMDDYDDDDEGTRGSGSRQKQRYLVSFCHCMLVLAIL